MNPLLKKRMKRTIFSPFFALLLKRIPARSQSRTRRLRHQISLETASHTLTNHRLATTGELPHNDQSTTRQRMKLPSYALPHGPNGMTEQCLAPLAEGRSTFEKTPGITIGMIVTTSYKYIFEPPCTLERRCLELQKGTR